MPLYSYVKRKPKRQRRQNEIVNFISYISLFAGSICLFWSLYPIISFELYSRLFISNKMISPVPLSKTASAIKMANSVLGTYQIFSTNLVDYTKVSIWFPKRPQEKISELKVKEYLLSIPKLNIKEAKVIVGGENLKKSLIQYAPKSLPGKDGNVVIFGHSTLPQLYNSKDFKTIFTYLPSLKEGDKIYIAMQDLNYEYEIYEMFVVNPEDISVLNQLNDASYLTLITCVPPGTYWKRLVVRAKLTKL